MSEQELKLHVPMASRADVERELKQAGAERLPLHAMYFDTPERELARARIAIRLRREGRNWVQTLKMPGANAITRVEMNHPRPGPILDLSVYAGTEVHSALAGLKGQLGLRYETDVTRLVRKTRTRLGTVEIAYDFGLLRAGDLELPISEVEFELVSGRLAAIFAAARGWLPRYGLVLDPRSKSERGDALAHLAQTLARHGLPDEARQAAIAQFWAPRFAKPVQLQHDMMPSQGLAAIAAECLDQIARNAAMLAEVDTLDVYGAGGPEHVHQLRVGMRRLRSAWRLFRGWAELPSGEMQSGLRAHFAAFGANRDQDVLQESIIPALVKAGMPTFPIPAGDTPPAAALDTAAGTPFQGWLLDLLEWTLDVRPAAEAGQAETAAVSSSAALAAPARAVASVAVAPSRGNGHDAGNGADHAQARQGTKGRGRLNGGGKGNERAIGGVKANGHRASTDAGDYPLTGHPHDAAHLVAHPATGASTHTQTQTHTHAKSGDPSPQAGHSEQGEPSGHAGHQGHLGHARQTGKAAGTPGAAPPAAATAASSPGPIHPTIIPLHPPRAPRNLHQLLARRLHKWHKRVLSEGERFVELDIPTRHELRKRAKRLRYGLSFAESLLPAQKMKDYRRRLAAVQDVLGEMNDLSVAHDLYRQWSSVHPQAWFALGWISARQEKLVGEAQRAFAKLGKAKAFWK